MITLFKCPTCHKSTVIKETKVLNEKYSFEIYACSHRKLVKATEITKKSGPLVSALNGNETFPFQDKGIQFSEKSGFKTLIADEMGLGKTVQAIGTVKLHQDELLPCIVICKSIAKYNWLQEFLNWLDARHIPQVINESSDTWFEQFNIHIMSYDMLRILTNEKKKRKNAYNEFYGNELDEKPIRVRPDVQKILNRAKLIIIDECHYIKNDTAQRTVALKRLCKNKPAIIALSGTPIKNNAAEFFPILNILHPDRFSNRASFINTYCQNVWTAYGYKVGGLNDPEHFKERTQDFIIRREMDDVLPEMPAVRRNHSFVVMEKDAEKIYDNAWKDFTQYFEKYGDKKDFETQAQILVKINVLRHITGIAKVDAAVEFVEEFVTETSRKIVLFVHHHKVAELLEIKLNDMIKTLNETGMHLSKPVLLLSQNIANAQNIVEEFKKPESRIMIASTLAAGESINLQFCSDCLLVERQWNPANEEQAAVGRFKRIGQVNSIGLTYLLAAGTIDDYFTELVERKRQIVNETMRGEKGFSDWNESSIVMELAQILASKGKEKFRL